MLGPLVEVGFSRGEVRVVGVKVEARPADVTRGLVLLTNPP